MYGVRTKRGYGILFDWKPENKTNKRNKVNKYNVYFIYFVSMLIRINLSNYVLSDYDIDEF